MDYLQVKTSASLDMSLSFLVSELPTTRARPSCHLKKKQHLSSLHRGAYSALCLQPSAKLLGEVHFSTKNVAFSAKHY